MSPRCWCGHNRATHEHYRPGFDCGECGVVRCHRYAGRDQPMPASHAEAAAVNDAHMYRNLWALSEYAQSARAVAAIRIPSQRPYPVAAYLDQKRAEHRGRYHRG